MEKLLGENGTFAQFFCFFLREKLSVKRGRLWLWMGWSFCLAAAAGWVALERRSGGRRARLGVSAQWGRFPSSGPGAGARAYLEDTLSRLRRVRSYHNSLLPCSRAQRAPNALAQCAPSALAPLFIDSREWTPGISQFLCQHWQIKRLATRFLS